LTLKTLEKDSSILQGKRLTVCVSGLWAGRDSLREQKKLHARKMLENAAESHKSTARFVGQPAGLPEPLPKKDNTANRTRFYRYFTNESGH